MSLGIGRKQPSMVGWWTLVLLAFGFSLLTIAVALLLPD